MSILETLDEKILQVYEKVNHYCYKGFGTDKYDLAQKADVAASITQTGAGTYMCIDGFSNQSHLWGIIWGVMGIGLAFSGLNRLLYSKGKNNNLKEKELEQIRTGSYKHVYKSSRPIWMAYGATTTGLFGAYLPNENNQNVLTFALALTCFGLFKLVEQSASYFRDCSMPLSKENKSNETIEDKF